MLSRLMNYLRPRLTFGGFEPASDYDPAMMARAGFYLYSSGAVIGLTVLLVPAQHRNQLDLVVIALCALALGYIELIGFDRLPLWVFQALTGCGTILVAAAVHEAGTTADIYQLLYVWVILYSAYFFSLRSFLLQAVVVVIASALVTWKMDSDGYTWLDWMLRNLTFEVAGALVYMLRRRWAAQLRIERDRVSRLREIDRLKDEFIAVASHELRTPVASLYGAAQTLNLVKLDDATRQRLIEIIGSEATRLTTRINAILRVEQIGNRRLPPLLETVSLNELVREAVDAAKIGSTFRVIEISLEMPPAPLLVRADAAQLREVLDNLLDNAIKYSPSGGRITLRGEQNDTEARLTVSDEGIGVPVGEEEAVFDKFYRADPDMTQGAAGGTGLGLYISRELLHGMGGTIDLVGKDVGTEVTLTLPLADSY